MVALIQSMAVAYAAKYRGEFPYDREQDEAETRIIEMSLPHVTRYFVTRRRVKADEDMLQWIRIGCLQALRTYSPQSSKYMTWAIHCCVNTVYRMHQQGKETISRPTGIQYAKGKIEKTKEILEITAPGEELSDERISEESGIPMNVINLVNHYDRVAPLSFDAFSPVVQDRIWNSAHTEDEFYKSDMRMEIEKYMETLPSKTKKAVTMKLDGYKLQEISEELGLTISQVRTILGRSIPILQSIVSPFLNDLP